MKIPTHKNYIFQNQLTGRDTVADPGFPVGGVDLVREGVDSRGGYVSKILYVKTKESRPLGGRVPGTPPRSANEMCTANYPKH